MSTQVDKLVVEENNKELIQPEDEINFNEDKSEGQEGSKTLLNLVLLEPEIPHNTGAIGRTCVATNTHLHLIRPLGFLLEDKWVKRTGLDYWPYLNYTVHENFASFLATVEDKSRIFFATTKAEKIHTEQEFLPGDYIVLGKESKGIPEGILLSYQEQCIRIPMWGDVRSLNLSNAASILVYEFYRQLSFPQFLLKGKLHQLEWN